MKKLLVLLAAIVMVPFVFTSCEKDEDVSFDKSLLTGKWVQGTVHYKYLANGTGGTLDTADDVSEAEARAFTWTLDGDQLTHIHAITKRNSLGIVVRRNVPKVYTVTELTATSLKYHDNFSVSYSYTKE